MASINDVYNQLVAVNGSLGQIQIDTVAGTTATNAVKASVDTLDGDVKAGFTAALNGLNVIAQINVETVKLLFHLTQQADTMICALEHISQNTCGTLTQVTIQTRLQQRLRDDADALRAITASAYPAAALEQHRLAALRAEIEKCCPPETPPPACTYAPCPAPRPVPMPDLPRVGHQPQPPR
jgi:hypothetical protein